MKLLEEGDIIRLEMGHKVSTKIPMHFVYDNKIGALDDLVSAPVVIGPVNKRGFDASYLAGDYVVVKTTMDGGGSGHGGADSYPDGHHVWCESINNLGPVLKVDFYQTGCFTTMNGEIPVIGKATREWKTDL